MTTFVNIMDLVYPVGSLYMSTAPTSPASIFVGQWSQIKNAMIAATGFGGNTSGKYSGNNTMTIDQMPKHEHKVARWNSRTEKYEAVDFSSSNAGSGTDWLLLSGASGTERTAYATSVGGSKPFYPYNYAANIWTRTS